MFKPSEPYDASDRLGEAYCCDIFTNTPITLVGAIAYGLTQEQALRRAQAITDLFNQTHEETKGSL